jgi:hypothetical protein
MSADFSKVAAHLAGNLVEHAKRDGLSPVMTAVFLSRGGHAPGTRCPSEPAAEPVHAMGCDLILDGEFCTCGAGR